MSLLNHLSGRILQERMLHSLDDLLSQIIICSNASLCMATSTTHDAPRHRLKNPFTMSKICGQMPRNDKQANLLSKLDVFIPGCLVSVALRTTSSVVAKPRPMTWLFHAGRPGLGAI